MWKSIYTLNRVKTCALKRNLMSEAWVIGRIRIRWQGHHSVWCRNKVRRNVCWVGKELAFVEGLQVWARSPPVLLPVLLGDVPLAYFLDICILLKVFGPLFVCMPHKPRTQNKQRFLPSLTSSIRNCLKVVSISWLSSDAPLCPGQLHGAYRFLHISISIYLSRCKYIV
jgi:hypothetical protein